ncbi:Uncharacterised protein [uncultured archaeon]|nr:Uncharacterised protein [uncultured archaeon]
MSEIDAYLQEFEEEICQRDIQERRKAEKNIAQLERCIRIYRSLKEGNVEQAKKLVERCLENSYERPRLHYKEITEGNFTPDFRETYGPEYGRAISKAQKTLFPDLFTDAPQNLKG